MVRLKAWVFLALAMVATAELAFDSSVDVEELTHAKVCGYGMCCKFTAELDFGAKQKAQHHAHSNNSKTEKKSGSTIYHFEICSQCGNNASAFYKMHFESVEASDPRIGTTFAKYPVFFRQSHETGKIDSVFLSSQDMKAIRRAKRSIVKAVARRIHPGALKEISNKTASPTEAAALVSDFEFLDEDFDETIATSDLEREDQKPLNSVSYSFYDTDELGEAILVEHTVSPWVDGGVMIDEEIANLEDEDHEKTPKPADFKAKTVHTKIHGHHKLRKMVQVRRKKKSRAFMDKSGHVVKTDEKAATKIGSAKPADLRQHPHVLAPDPGRAQFQVHYKMHRRGNPRRVAACTADVSQNELLQVANQMLDGTEESQLYFVEDVQDLIEDSEASGPEDDERLHRASELLDTGAFDASDLGEQLRPSVVTKVVSDAWGRYHSGALGVDGMKTVLGALAPVRGHAAATELLEAVWDKDLPSELRTQAAVSLALRGPKGSDVDIPEFVLEGLSNVAYGPDSDPLRDTALLSLGALLEDHQNAEPYIARMSEELQGHATGRHHLLDLAEDVAAEDKSERHNPRALSILLALANAGVSAQDAAPHVARFLKSRSMKEKKAAAAALSNMDLQIQQADAAVDAFSPLVEQQLELNVAKYTASDSKKDDYGSMITPKTPLITSLDRSKATAIYDETVDGLNGCDSGVLRKKCPFGGKCADERDAALVKCYVGRFRQGAHRTFVDKATKVYNEAVGEGGKPGLLQFDPSQMNIKALRARRIGLEGFARKLSELTNQFLWASWIRDLFEEHKKLVVAALADPTSTNLPPDSPPNPVLSWGHVQALHKDIETMKEQRAKLRSLAKPIHRAFLSQWQKVQEHEMAKESGTMIEYNSCKDVKRVPWVHHTRKQVPYKRTSKYWASSCNFAMPPFPPTEETAFEGVVPLGATTVEEWTRAPVLKDNLFLTWRQVIANIYTCVGESSKQVLSALEKHGNGRMPWDQQYEYQLFYDEATVLLAEADDYFVAHFRFQCGFEKFAKSLGKEHRDFQEKALKAVDKAESFWKAMVARRKDVGPQYQAFGAPTLHKIASLLNAIRANSEEHAMEKTEQKWDYAVCKNGRVGRTKWTGVPPGTEKGGKGEAAFEALEKNVRRNLPACYRSFMKTRGLSKDEAKLQCLDSLWAQAASQSDYGLWMGRARALVESANCEYEAMNTDLNTGQLSRAKIVKILGAWDDNGLGRLASADPYFSAIKRIQCAWADARTQYEEKYDKDHKLARAREEMSKREMAAGAKSMQGVEQHVTHGGGLQGDVRKSTNQCKPVVENVVFKARVASGDMLANLEWFLNLEGFIEMITSMRDTARYNGGELRVVLERKLQNIASYDRWDVPDEDDDCLFKLGITNPWILRTKSGEYGAKMRVGWGQPSDVKHSMTSEELVEWYELLSKPSNALKEAWKRMTLAMKAEKVASSPPNWGDVQMYQGDIGLRAVMRSKKLNIMNVAGSVGFSDEPAVPAKFGVEYTFSVFGIRISHKRQTHEAEMHPAGMCVGLQTVAQRHAKGVVIDGSAIHKAVGYKHKANAGWNFPLGCWYGILIHVRLAATGDVGMGFFFQVQPQCDGKRFLGSSVVDKPNDAAVLAGLDGFGKVKMGIGCSADFWGGAEVYVKGEVVVFDSHVSAFSTSMIEIKRSAKVDIVTQPLSLDITIGLRSGKILQKIIKGVAWLKHKRVPEIRMEKTWKYKVPSHAWGAVMWDSQWQKKLIAKPPVVGLFCEAEAAAAADLLTDILFDLDNDNFDNLEGTKVKGKTTYDPSTKQIVCRKPTAAATEEAPKAYDPRNALLHKVVHAGEMVRTGTARKYAEEKAEAMLIAAKAAAKAKVEAALAEGKMSLELKEKALQALDKVDDAAKLVAEMEKLAVKAKHSGLRLDKATLRKLERQAKDEVKKRVHEAKDRAKEELQNKVDEAKAEVDRRVEQAKQEAMAEVQRVKQEVKAEAMRTVHDVKRMAEAELYRRIDAAIAQNPKLITLKNNIIATHRKVKETRARLQELKSMAHNAERAAQEAFVSGAGGAAVAKFRNEAESYKTMYSNARTQLVAFEKMADDAKRTAEEAVGGGRSQVAAARAEGRKMVREVKREGKQQIRRGNLLKEETIKSKDRAVKPRDASAQATTLLEEDWPEASEDIDHEADAEEDVTLTDLETGPSHSSDSRNLNAASMSAKRTIQASLKLDDISLHKKLADQQAAIAMFAETATAKIDTLKTSAERKAAVKRLERDLGQLSAGFTTKLHAWVHTKDNEIQEAATKGVSSVKALGRSVISRERGKKSAKNTTIGSFNKAVRAEGRRTRSRVHSMAHKTRSTLNKKDAIVRGSVRRQAKKVDSAVLKAAAGTLKTVKTTAKSTVRVMRRSSRRTESKLARQAKKARAADRRGVQREAKTIEGERRTARKTSAEEIKALEKLEKAQADRRQRRQVRRKTKEILREQASIKKTFRRQTRRRSARKLRKMARANARSLTRKLRKQANSADEAKEFQRLRKLSRRINAKRAAKARQSALERTIGRELAQGQTAVTEGEALSDKLERDERDAAQRRRLARLAKTVSSSVNSEASQDKAFKTAVKTVKKAKTRSVNAQKRAAKSVKALLQRVAARATKRAKADTLRAGIKKLNTKEKRLASAAKTRRLVRRELKRSRKATRKAAKKATRSIRKRTAKFTAAARIKNLSKRIRKGAKENINVVASQSAKVSEVIKRKAQKDAIAMRQLSKSLKVNGRSARKQTRRTARTLRKSDHRTRKGLRKLADRFRKVIHGQEARLRRAVRR